MSENSKPYIGGATTTNVSPNGSVVAGFAGSNSAVTLFISNLGTGAATIIFKTASGTVAHALAAGTSANDGTGGQMWIYGITDAVFIGGASTSVSVTVFS